MDKLHKILTSLTPELEFRIKFACEPSSKELSLIQSRLTDRYDAIDIGPLVKTIFQTSPIDFPELDCGEIWYMDFKCFRSVSPSVLVYEIGDILKWSESLLRVRSLLEPFELNQEEDIELDEYLPRIADPDFTDAKEYDVSEYAGQTRTDTAVKDAVEQLKTPRSAYSEFMAAGFGKKD